MNVVTRGRSKYLLAGPYTKRIVGKGNSTRYETVSPADMAILFPERDPDPEPSKLEYRPRPSASEARKDAKRSAADAMERYKESRLDDIRRWHGTFKKKKSNPRRKRKYSTRKKLKKYTRKARKNVPYYLSTKNRKRRKGKKYH